MSLGFSRWVVFCIFAIGMGGMHRPILEGSHEYIHGDLGDSRLVNLLLEHAYQYTIGQKELSFWSPYWQFYPVKNSLSYSETMLGSMPLYLIPRALGMEPLAAYQIWILLVATLNFWFCYLLLRKMSADPIPAATGAFLFAFSLPVSGFLFHTQLMPRFFMPLAILMLLSAIREVSSFKRFAKIMAFYVFSGMQLWASSYIGWFYFLSLFLAGMILCVVVGWQRIVSVLLMDLKAHLWSLVVFFLILIPLVLKYASFSSDRAYLAALHSLPTLSSYFKSHSYSIMYSQNMGFVDALLPGGPGAGQIFIGFMASCLLIMALGLVLVPQKYASQIPLTRLLYKNKGERTIILLIAMLYLFVFFLILRFQDKSFWYFIYHYMPGATKIREVIRISLVLILFGSILIAWFMTRIQYSNPLVKALGYVLIVAIVLFENQANPKNNFSKAEHQLRMQALTKMIQGSVPCDAFYYSKKGEVHVITQVDAMWASLLAGVPTINGYSGTRPKGWNFDAQTSLAELQNWTRNSADKNQAMDICIFRQ